MNSSMFLTLQISVSVELCFRPKHAEKLPAIKPSNIPLCYGVCSNIPFLPIVEWSRICLCCWMNRLSPFSSQINYSMSHFDAPCHGTRRRLVYRPTWCSFNTDAAFPKHCLIHQDTFWTYIHGREQAKTYWTLHRKGAFRLWTVFEAKRKSRVMLSCRPKPGLIIFGHQ